jgi:hypothetical protein
MAGLSFSVILRKISARMRINIKLELNTAAGYLESSRKDE